MCTSYTCLVFSGEAYSEPFQTSKKECFCVTVNDFKPLTFYVKSLYLRCLKGIWIRNKDEDSEEYPQTYCGGLNQTLLTQKYQEPSHNTFYGLEAYGTH